MEDQILYCLPRNDIQGSSGFSRTALAVRLPSKAISLSRERIGTLIEISKHKMPLTVRSHCRNGLAWAWRDRRSTWTGHLEGGNARSGNRLICSSTHNKSLNGCDSALCVLV